MRQSTRTHCGISVMQALISGEVLQQKLQRIEPPTTTPTLDLFLSSASRDIESRLGNHQPGTTVPVLCCWRWSICWVTPMQHCWRGAQAPADLLLAR